jgi:hypothetical protein
MADKNHRIFEEFGARARKTYEQRFDPGDSMQQLLDIYRYATENPVLNNAGQFTSRPVG